MDINNLIYNGDFTDGTNSWSGSSLTLTNDPSGNYITLNGDLSQNIFIPVSSDRTYRLTFDLKVNSNCGSYFYIALKPYDSSKNLIGITTTYIKSNTNTTLAEDLVSGDTTVTLTDATNWDSTYQYQRIGICDILAYGYNRNSKSYSYSSREENVLTLKSAYSGSTIPAGTKVANFRDGSTYYYPWSNNSSNLPTEWKTYSVTFTGGNSMRYSTKYFKFSTLGYTHNYSMRNIKIECISDTQLNENVKNILSVGKNGQIKAFGYNELGRNIRYIRDTTNGSTANTANHLCEIQAFNSVGENIAWNKKVNDAYTLVTDGSTKSSPYYSTSGEAILDLEFIERIEKIKIWHYWADGRTYYDNVVEVSTDGNNWTQVYSGEHPETSDGFEIILIPENFKVNKNGTIYSTELYEY